MVISFDLDETLIPYSNEFEVEEKTVMARLTKAENIRKGTIELWRQLEDKGHKIWIYTTSFRSSISIERTFKSYGLHPSKIINGKINQKELAINNCSASKNPKLFGIDIHIDDSEGVKIEGEKFGFNVVNVSPNNADWTETILKRILAIETNSDWQFEQLITTLIALKSKPNVQREIYGIGNTEDEMAIEFDSYFTQIRNLLLKLDYIDDKADKKLVQLHEFLEFKSNQEDKSFWIELETHKDWDKIRTMAEQILLTMGKENLIVEVAHDNSYNSRNEIISQITNTKLIERKTGYNNI